MARKVNNPDPIVVARVWVRGSETLMRFRRSEATARGLEIVHDPTPQHKARRPARTKAQKADA